MKFPSVDPSATVPATGGGDRPVLVVESDADQRRRVTAQLANWGYAPVAAGSGEEAIELVANAHFAFSLVAIRLPGMSGVDFLRRAQDLCDTGHVIMVADNGHSSQIVEAIQTGADDFIRRPYTSEDLENAIKAVAGRPRPVAPTAATAPAGGDENGARLERELGLLVSPPMREVQSIVEQAARADVTVLICGETGVGKELIAHSMHAQSAPRRPPFVNGNLGAAPAEPLQSRLLGPR